MNRKQPDNGYFRQPLCKFGPGGDFTKKWSLPAPGGQFRKENTLEKVLSALGEIIGATISSETFAELQNQVDMDIKSYTTPKKEIIAVEPQNTKNRKNRDNTASAQGAQRHCLVRGQTMLFSDDRRDRTRTKRKPNNNIRAHRRPARKKAAHEIQGQGTLFDNYAKGTTAA